MKNRAKDFQNIYRETLRDQTLSWCPIYNPTSSMGHYKTYETSNISKSNK